MGLFVCARARVHVCACARVYLARHSRQPSGRTVPRGVWLTTDCALCVYMWVSVRACVYVLQVGAYVVGCSLAKDS